MCLANYPQLPMVLGKAAGLGDEPMCSFEREYRARFTMRLDKRATPTDQYSFARLSRVVFDRYFDHVEGNHYVRSTLSHGELTSRMY